MTRTFGAQDMSGPLRRVMMRAPGAAMRAADPAKWHYGPGFNPAKAEAQHAALAALIAATEAEIHWLPSADDGLSDAIFTQDPSFVTDAGAVLLNMGKPLRRAEPELHRTGYAAMGVPILGQLTGDATVESGDCVWVDAKTLAIGRGARSNQAGISALADMLAPQGISVLGFDLPVWTGPDACLHLMSLISPLAPDLALIYEPLMPYAFWSMLRDRGWLLLRAPESEFIASNGLSLNVLPTAPRDVIMVAGFPKTAALMAAADCHVQTFVGDALCIACEGGPTCLTRPVLRG